jgi:hypothetical protein
MTLIGSIRHVGSVGINAFCAAGLPPFVLACWLGLFALSVAARLFGPT